MRTYDDLSQELLQLRDATRKYSDEAKDQRDEIKALKAELAWWRKTFGPDKFAAI